ncbi:MAG: bacteriocin family protein [Candidatus Izimaplasma sp.]|nr:bacteriocin family protein [Candidatus Izimaplasma bacterium]
MDLFKQNLAPISDQAWEEIKTTASDVIKNYLTARKALFVNGPLGLEKESISMGRLNVVKSSGDVEAGVYDIKPLLETRIHFKLDRWELDNIDRGAKDAVLDPLEDAAKEMALFEEKTVYYGSKDAKIDGLVDLAEHKFDLELTSEAIFDSMSEAVLALQDAFADGPYTLVAGKKVYKALQKPHGGRLLIDLVKTLIGGDVIYSSVLEGALLLPYNHEDLELIIGQDYKVGFKSANEKEVELFIMNAFTTRISDPGIIAYFKV